MSGRVFLDSNVWIYAATGRDACPEKFSRARNIVAREEIGISTQVIGEFVHNVRKEKKMRRPLSAEETGEWVERLFDFPCVEIDRYIVENALLIQRRYRLSYWDSQMIAAAESFGAEIFYSEDLSHQQSYGPLRCKNPFRDN
jgi:predicted nucleic acid-binding protein